MEVPAEWVDFFDPNWPGRWGPPIPPRHAPGGNRRLRVVWPRDKKQKGAHTWGRFRDVLSGRGPDMWIGRKGDIGPTRPEWSRWDEGSKGGVWNNLGYWDSRDTQIPAWRPGHVAEQKRYDFNTRRYELPHLNTWSDVKWDQNGRYPLYVRDHDGEHHIHPDLPQNRNPFEYSPRTNWWEWYRGQLPLDFPRVVYPW